MARCFPIANRLVEYANSGKDPWKKDDVLTKHPLGFVLKQYRSLGISQNAIQTSQNAKYE